ncbi:MAG TPA: serine/threonine-protein kinase [Bryobacteraceae bacterium]|jgi:serine/threonine-protein kinase|nr:serine/threonine-protein kinase [Bryobacteraceae bacterium]
MDRIGRYQIVRELGRGAMGVVYLATDPTIGRQVAIKTIRLGEVSNAAERDRLRERLFREARSAGKLSHPGIVTIYDMEEHDDVAYIAMEYVNGPTLDDLLCGPEPLPSSRLFSILGQTAVALDYAHQKGIVHRDIKPANIMIDEEGTAKITDFGIAKVTASEQFTVTGAILGTPHYMSPEQVQGLLVDGRADQFSLAVIAYEMLTGEKPFTGDQLTTVVYKIVAEEPPSPQRLNATLSQQIEAVLRKGLAKKPENRYPNCQKFLDALEEACRITKGWKAMVRGASLSQTTAYAERRPDILPPLRHRRQEADEPEERRKGGFFPFLMAILAAAGVIALVAWQAGPWLTESMSRQMTGQSNPAPPAPAPPAVPSNTPGAVTDQRPSSLGAPDAQPNGAAGGTPAGSGTQPIQTMPAQAEPATQAPAPPAAEKPIAEKPAPPSEEEEAEAPAAQPPSREHRETPSRPRLRNLGPFTIQVESNPVGAIAVLDNRPDMSCTTPCKLEAMPGRHAVAVKMAGHQTEYRQVEVSDVPVELPVITLRGATGVLMVATTPSGASIYVNGRLWQQRTPAQIGLAPGAYRITVEKEGRRVTKDVTIQNAVTSFLRLTIAP